MYRNNRSSIWNAEGATQRINAVKLAGGVDGLATGQVAGSPSFVKLRTTRRNPITTQTHTLPSKRMAMDQSHRGAHVHCCNG